METARHTIEIDINKLSLEELKFINNLVFRNDYNVENMRIIEDREAYLEGWMNEKQETEYLKKYFGIEV